MNIRSLKKITQKNRLGLYEKLLRHAIAEGYKLVSLEQWYESYLDTNERILILRHDVDYDYKGAKQMYLLEKGLNVKSTFYFRWSSMNEKIMRAMKKDGFEVSLHYETLAQYAKDHGLKNGDEVTKEVMDMCFNLLLDELDEFENKFWKVKTICSHGDKVNRKLKISNHRILKTDEIKNRGIYFCTYDANILAKYDAYISDNSIYNGFEWQHGGNPFEQISEHKNTICLLTHPVHWNQGFIKNIEMLFKVYFDNNN